MFCSLSQQELTCSCPEFDFFEGRVVDGVCRCKVMDMTYKEWIELQKGRLRKYGVIEPSSDGGEDESHGVGSQVQPEA